MVDRQENAPSDPTALVIELLLGIPPPTVATVPALPAEICELPPRLWFLACLPLPRPKIDLNPPEEDSLWGELTPPADGLRSIGATGGGPTLEADCREVGRPFIA